MSPPSDLEDAILVRLSSTKRERWVEAARQPIGGPKAKGLINSV